MPDENNKLTKTDDDFPVPEGYTRLKLDGSSKVLHSEWQKVEAERARSTGFIVKESLVYILAVDEQYQEEIPRLWNTYQLPVRKSKTPDVSTPISRVGTWLALIERWTEGTVALSHYLTDSNIPRLKLYSIDKRTGEFKINNEEGDYLNLSEVQKYFTSTLNIQLPTLLFPSQSTQGESITSVLNTQKPQDKAVDEATVDSFIRSLKFSYLDSTEIRIIYKGKPTHYSYGSMGFRDSNTEAWKTFLGILQDKDHVYKLGPANSFHKELHKKVRIKAYYQRRELLRAIDKKLKPFLAKEYKVSFPPEFKSYERQPTQGSGIYSFKFEIPSDKPSYKTKVQALKRLETLIQEEASTESIQEAVEIAMEAGATKEEVFKLTKDWHPSQSKYHEIPDESDDKLETDNYNIDDED